MSIARRHLWVLFSVQGLFASGQNWQELVIPAPFEVAVGGHFGASIALDEDHLLIGAPGVSIGAPATGSAYVFDRNEGGENGWGLVATFHLPTPVSGARLGSRVHLAGDLAFVAAPHDLNIGMQTGSVYVFQKDLGGANNWGFKQRIRPDTIQQGLGFGKQLQYVNGSLIVACPGYDENTADALAGMGGIAMYSINGSGVFEPYRFVRGDELVDEVTARPCAGDWFDVSGIYFVHVQKETIVGDVLNGFRPGRGYYLNADSLLDVGPSFPGAHRINLTNTFGDAPDSIVFTSGAANHGFLAIGLWHYRSQDGFHRAVTLADDGFGGLEQLASATPDSAAGTIQFYPLGREGWDVLDLSDHRLLVGASGHSTLTPLGHAEVFSSYNGGATDWTRIAYLQPSDPHAGDLFGATGAISEEFVVIGAPTYGPLDRGQVYVFNDPTVGVRESGNDFKPELSVHPVPVSRGGTIRVTINSMSGGGTLNLVDVRGGVLGHWTAGSIMDIGLDGLSAGAYLLNWIPDNGRDSPGSTRVIIMP